MIGSGTFKGYIFDSLNKKVPIKIKDVVFCPNLGVNLLSITKFLSDGGNLTSEGLKLVISKNGKRISFDKIIKTPRGYVNGLNIIIKEENEKVHDLIKFKKHVNKTS